MAIDYERIARVYDELPVRHRLTADPCVAEESPGPDASAGTGGNDVLDVGCGTGLYLAACGRAAPRARLFGVDPSPGMLAQARARLPGAALSRAQAEALPFGAARFDHAALRFVHHHLSPQAQEGALDELLRVLRPGGVLRFENLLPAEMPGFWIYSAFPASRALNAPYWGAERLVAGLRARGFSEVTLERRRTEGTLSKAEAVAQARRRDQTHLAGLADADFAAGLARLEAEPDAVRPTETVIAVVRGRR